MASPALAETDCLVAVDLVCVFVNFHLSSYPDQFRNAMHYRKFGSNRSLTANDRPRYTTEIQNWRDMIGFPDKTYTGRIAVRHAS